MDKETIRKDHYTIFDVNTVRMKLNDTEGTFYQIDAPNWAVVIAEVEGKLLCVEQFRIGAEQMTLEFPGGVIDEGEMDTDGGLRELVEETGYSGEACEIGRFKSNPAIMTNDCIVVRVNNAEFIGAQQLDPFERIEVKLLDVNAIEAAIQDGCFCNAIHIAAFYIWLKWHEKN